MIIDHIGFAVSDYDKSKQFFCRALSPPEVPTTGRREFGSITIPTTSAPSYWARTATMWKRFVTGPNSRLRLGS